MMLRVFVCMCCSRFVHCEEVAVCVCVWEGVWEYVWECKKKKGGKEERVGGVHYGRVFVYVYGLQGGLFAMHLRDT